VSLSKDSYSIKEELLNVILAEFQILFLLSLNAAKMDVYREFS